GHPERGAAEDELLQRPLATGAHDQQGRLLLQVQQGVDRRTAPRLDPGCDPELGRQLLDVLPQPGDGVLLGVQHRADRDDLGPRPTPPSLPPQRACARSRPSSPPPRRAPPRGPPPRRSPSARPASPPPSRTCGPPPPPTPSARCSPASRSANPSSRRPSPTRGS